MANIDFKGRALDVASIIVTADLTAREQEAAAASSGMSGVDQRDLSQTQLTRRHWTRREVSELTSFKIKAAKGLSGAPLPRSKCQIILTSPGGQTNMIVGLGRMSAHRISSARRPIEVSRANFAGRAATQIRILSVWVGSYTRMKLDLAMRAKSLDVHDVRRVLISTSLQLALTDLVRMLWSRRCWPGVYMVTPSVVAERVRDVVMVAGGKNPPASSSRPFAFLLPPSRPRLHCPGSSSHPRVGWGQPCSSTRASYLPKYAVREVTSNTMQFSKACQCGT